MLTLLVASAPTAAAQSVYLAWGGCAGAISRTVESGDVADLYVSLLGHSQPHRGYQVAIRFYSAGSVIRDAWRFDAEGCQDPALLTIDHLSPASIAKACPSFSGGLGPIQYEDYAYDSATGRTTAVVGVAYSEVNTAQVDPAQRYFLARIRFDHANSVIGLGEPDSTCGRLEVPACGYLHRTSWLTADGVEVQWAWGWEHVSANDTGGGAECDAVPATPATWGGVKSQYRR